MEKALEIAKEIEVPAEVLLKESIVEVDHKVIELTKNPQQLVVVGINLDDVEESHKEKDTCSEVASSDTPRGNTNSSNISNIIEV